jgi:prepilin-type N-terminal cleavage/methylation domain-containing protein
MRTTRRAAASERGETLLELLIAVVIMGIALVAIVGGLAVSIQVSDIHRKQADAGAWARSSAESVEAWVAAGNFPVCGNTGTYPPITVPSGYTGNVSACAATSGGLPRLTITVSSSDGRASESVALVVRKAA